MADIPSEIRVVGEKKFGIRPEQFPVDKEQVRCLQREIAVYIVGPSKKTKDDVMALLREYRIVTPMVLMDQAEHAHLQMEEERTRVERDEQQKRADEEQREKTESIVSQCQSFGFPIAPEQIDWSRRQIQLCDGFFLEFDEFSRTPKIILATEDGYISDALTNEASFQKAVADGRQFRRERLSQSDDPTQPEVVSGAKKNLRSSFVMFSSFPPGGMRGPWFMG